MLITKTYFKGDCDYPRLHCDSCFHFDDVKEKWLRKLIGNCLYNEIKANLDVNGIDLADTAPQYLKDSVNGVEYNSINSCCCSCSDCDTRVFGGIIKILALAIKYQYGLENPYTYKVMVVGTEKIEKKIANNRLKMSIWNKLTKLNNVHDCTCVSLWDFINDNEEIYKTFRGLKTRIINY